MTSVKPISREHRIYLALWRKAFLSPDTPVSFKCSNYSMAVAVRQGMYRAIKPFRYGEQQDIQLREAAEKFVIALIKQKDENDKPYSLEDYPRHLPHWIELKKRLTLEEANSLFDEFELDESELYLGEERELSEKLKALVEKPEKVKKQSKATKFYERD